MKSGLLVVGGILVTVSPSAIAQDQQWYAWAAATAFTTPMNCDVSPVSPIQMAEQLKGVRLSNMDGAGLVIEDQLTGVTPIHFFRTKDACLAYVRTRTR